MIPIAAELHVDFRGLTIDERIEEIEEELAYRIVDEARRFIDESKPSGRIYRRGSIKGSRTKEGIAAGLRRSGKTRMIVGSRFHRASAPGQPLAEDSGESYRDITVRRVGKGNYRVRFGAGQVFGNSWYRPICKGRQSCRRSRPRCKRHSVSRCSHDHA
jgi:hypothetical protein